jgi:uncharacterized protein (TIGR02611 family)
MPEESRRRPMDHVRVVRERIRARRASRAVYRFVVALLGVVITLGGLVLVPLPGPGWLIVFAGLALLATEFDAARRVLEFGRRTLRRGTTGLGEQGLGVRAGLGLGTLVCVAAALWGAGAVAGVPGWVPDVVVPPLPGLKK